MSTGSIKRVCVRCGVTFGVPPSRLRYTPATYCTLRCRSADRAEAYEATFPERFWAKVDQSGGPDACWPWTASLGTTGYGQVSRRGRMGKKCHRIAWELTNGPIPTGGAILHVCDNRPCCNPAHLRLGTIGDNNRDTAAKGRHPAQASERLAPLLLWLFSLAVRP